MKVLIADDDLETIRMLETAMIDWGYGVVSVCDGKAAWEAIQKKDRPDLAILDWKMPHMDGIELVQKIRKEMPDAPIYIIVLTLRDSRYDMIHGFEAGADDYIPKPFRREELRVRLKAAQRIVELQATLAKRVEELQGALAHLHTLQGILPICSKCHKIRDNKDIWRQLEAYIEEHSEAMFSHSLCPECYKQFCIEAGIEPEDLSQPPKKDG